MSSRHVPSAARALVQEAKRRGPHGALRLVDDARRLEDPYFVASVLFFLSGYLAIPIGEARALALEAVDAASRVDRDWRRAEVLTEIARELKSWGGSAHGGSAVEAKRAIGDALMETVLAIRPGQGRSDAVRGVAVHVDPRGPHATALLSHALGHAGFALDDAKAVVRAWALGLGRRVDARALADVVGVIERVPDAALRAHVLGYVHLQAQKATRGGAPSTAFDAALEAAKSAPEDARLDALRYLATIADGETDLTRVRDAVDVLPDPESRVRLLSTLGGFADKRRLRDLGKRWLEEGTRAAESLSEAGPRAVTRANLAKGFARSGMTLEARALVEAAREDVESVADAPERLRVSHRVRAAGEAVGAQFPHDWPPGVADLVQEKAAPAAEAPTTFPGKRPGRASTPVNALPATGRPRRDVLVLHGAYEGGLTPAHVRAVARAAPLCDAFGLDLVLVGFPSTDASELAESVTRDTNVGSGGRHVRALADAGRIRLEASTPNWGALAEVVVATTSRPEAGKALGMSDAVARAGASGRVALVMGLGKQGLPREVLDAAPHHLELTGARVSFETAVAMGVMAERLRAARSGPGASRG